MDSERSEVEDAEDAPVEVLPKEVRLAEDGDDTLPNSLVITVLQARHLQPSPLRSTLSCYVKLSSLGVEYKTSVMTKTREPRWHEVFVFRAADWTTNVTVSVRDRLPFKMHFLGQVAISSADIANLPGMITRRWFRLRDRGITGQFTGAELELKVALVYTKANDQALSQTGPAAMELQRGVDPALADVLAGQDDETEEEAAARTKALLRRETQEREASAALAALKQGDYQVQVHVIEARDLKGENLSGTSDPYCQVEMLGVSKKTATKYDTLGCVFDEILFFNFANIGRHELREASINISVYDKERILKDNLIGIYQLDCLSVYAQPDHELYRQWIAVHDNLNEKDRGIQGFLLVSVVVLGPGDALCVHDREAEMELELTEATGEKADDSPSTTSPLVLVPPTIELKLQFLVVRVLRAEHLPAMDSGMLIGAPGIDAYVQVMFAANAPCKSSVVTVKGRGHLAPDFYEELWLPVHIPTFSRHIGLSVWDRDLTSPNELVGVASHDFLQVPAAPFAEESTSVNPPESAQKVELKLEDSEEEIDIENELTATGMREKLELEEAQHQIVAAAPRWYNLYGPPLHGSNSKRKKLVSRHAELGSTYRGRVLLSMVRMESPKPEVGEKMHVKSMAGPDREQFEKMIPQTVKYMLRGALYSGVELPRSSSPTITGNQSQVRVKLSLGPYSITFESQEVAKDGSATFEQCLDHRSVLELPADLTQIPDIIVTLSRTIGGVVSTSTEEFISVSFARFRCEEVFAGGFTAKPQWVVLREEITRRQTRYALETSQSPGVLLLKLGFGRLEMATRHPWVNEADNSELFAPFRSPRVHREIRVHVFQARGLEASIGVARPPSPALNVRCCGQQKRTITCPSTPAPVFNESLVFLTNVPASDVVYTPEILFQVQDMSGSGGSTILGELRLSLSSAVRSVDTAGAPKPRWYELKRPRSRSSSSVSLLLAEQAGGGAAGQVLIAIQYIDHPGVLPPAVLRQPASIAPKLTEANLDIVALGVRHLKALSTLGIRRPHVEFELVGGSFVDEPKVKRIESFLPPKPKWKQTESDQSTAGSISSKNANFLDRIVARVKLPVDTLYAPQLHIRVCDSTLGGLRKTTLASCIVDLTTKLPWSSTYRVEIASGSGSPFRSPPKRKQKAKGQDWGENPADEDEFEDFLLDEDQPEEEMSRSGDDGVGVGDLSLPSVSYVHTRVSNALTLDTDPALFEQRRREEQRRYNAGKSALLLSHRAKAHATALGSPKTSEQSRVPYLQGRDWWISQCGGQELENFFTTPALESYQLQRPVLSRPSLLSFERVRVLLRAGIFKGRITVLERRTMSDSRSPEQERAKQDALELRRLQNGPQPVVVRVYVLRGQNLHPRSSKNYPNPYLRLKLGSDRINDQANACTNTRQPEFFRVFELETTLPGASQLDMSVWDRGLISDQLIGATTIDLEERWFHREWQEIGDDLSAGNRSNKLKPIEYRHLYVPQSRTTSQGFLQLWVDILTTQEAVRIKPVDISPPEPKIFEIRVVVWRAENVEDQVQSEINDYFVKAWMENSDSGSEKAECTDTHWRCSNGKPCWNWRLILKTEFPPRSPEMARLHLQLWDKDVLKWNDVLGEAQLDLYKWLRRAYETNRSVSPFLELKRLSQQPEDNIDAQKEGSEDTEEDFSEAFDEEDKDTGVKLLPGEQSSLLDKSSAKPAEKKQKRVQKRPESSAATRKMAKNQKDEAEAEAALSGLLDFMGLGRLPDDAEWIPIYFTDREAAVSMEMGQIGISLQIVPEDEAVASPVGKGQNAPNLNPYLPPPVGRMRLTANPIAMFKVLVGPKMCLRLSLLCCCFGCIAFISVFGATVMSTLTYLQSIEARHHTSSP